MAAKILSEIQSVGQNEEVQRDSGSIGCSVGIMAYNEEANIGRTIHAVLEQQSSALRIDEVIVVASGCTDRTVPIVTELALQEPRVRLSVQEKREGKASAINLFLKQATSPIVVLIGADVIPEASALEYLCEPLTNPQIGMVGGRPVPVNNPMTFMGHAVHLLWRLHDRMARLQPKLGEVIAFRNVISGIPIDSPVDEISIQALISQLGYQLIYEPACIVYNKGPLTVRDFLKQRRRIYAGHLQVREQQSYEASTMNPGLIFRELVAYRDFVLKSPRQFFWTLGTIVLEGIARVQGYSDYRQKRQHHVWQMVDSTKDLEADKQKVRRICNSQSVLVFRCLLAGEEEYDIHSERQEREANEALRKLLPHLRARIRKEDRLAISGPGILTVVIRAEQHGAELVAKRLQEIAQTTLVKVGMRGREVQITLTYSILTFALQADTRKKSASL